MLLYVVCLDQPVFVSDVIPPVPPDTERSTCLAKFVSNTPVGEEELE